MSVEYFIGYAVLVFELIRFCSWRKPPESEFDAAGAHPFAPVIVPWNLSLPYDVCAEYKLISYHWLACDPLAQ